MADRRLWILLLILIMESFNAFAQDPKFGNRIDCGLIEYDRIAEGNGYFTISEELGDFPTHLYFYPRLCVKAAP